MKSIKPGRGPSAINGIAGIGTGLFGVFWTITALKMGAPIMFAAFGILFIIMSVVNVIYNFKNAVNKNRMTMYDITDSNEEIDPIEKYVNKDGQAKEISYNSTTTSFCPYCGKELDGAYSFCPKCGKDISKV